MTIQLHRLEGFYRVAIAGGYARAARQFPYPITQPAVHQQVRKLEKELGVKLFERISKDRVIPTPPGRQLLAFCTPFFERLPQVVRSIRMQETAGELRMDASGLALRQLLPRWLQALRRAHPDLQVSLQEVAQPDAQRLRTGEADIVVDYWPEAPPDLQRLTVAEAQIFLIMPRSHKLARRKQLALTELGDEPFVSYHESLPHHRLQSAELSRMGVKPRRNLSASSAESILGFVAAGLGYSLIPWLDPRGPRMRDVASQLYAGGRGKHPIDAVWREGPVENLAIKRALASAPSLAAAAT